VEAVEPARARQPGEHRVEHSELASAELAQPNFHDDLRSKGAERPGREPPEGHPAEQRHGQALVRRHATAAIAAASSAGTVSAIETVPRGAMSAGSVIAASTAGPMCGRSRATSAGGWRRAVTRNAARIA
jgi:hypothetical protein